MSSIVQRGLSLSRWLGAIMMRGMVIDMNDEQMHTLAQIQAFLDGTIEVDFAVAADERYDFIARTVRRFGHGRLRHTDKALVLRFLERVHADTADRTRPCRAQLGLG